MRIWKGCLLGAALIVCGAPLTLAPAAMAAAVASTQAATQVTTTTATLNGTIDPNNPDSAYAFQYGTSPSAMNHDTTPTSAGTGEQQVSASITGLTPDQTYYFQLVVAQGVGYQPTYSYGGVQSFTTLPAPATVATTGAATSVTATSAVLNGVANTSTSISQWGFQYGPSAGYGEATKLETIGPGLHALSYRISGLRPDTVYHYRLDVLQYDQSGAHGSAGADQIFRTPALLGRVALRSSRLRVSHGRVSIDLDCVGAAGSVCDGRLALATRHARRTLSCAGGAFSLAGGHGAILHERLSRPCAALLAHARGRRLGATLSASYARSVKPVLRRRVLLLA